MIRYEIATSSQHQWNDVCLFPTYTTGTFPNYHTKLLSISEWCDHRYNADKIHWKPFIYLEVLIFIPIFLVYDITKRSSFLSIQRWIEEVRRYTTSDVILILIGNKCDLEGEREVIELPWTHPWNSSRSRIQIISFELLYFVQVELSEAQALCQYIPEISFVMETSAKENTNISDIFYLLATELMVGSCFHSVEIQIDQFLNLFHSKSCSKGSRI